MAFASEVGVAPLPAGLPGIFLKSLCCAAGLTSWRVMPSIAASVLGRDVIGAGVRLGKGVASGKLPGC